MARENSKGREAAESKSNDFTKAPATNLPKADGSIPGNGEKFAANPFTGTGSLTAPIATSPVSSDFDPQCSLSYDSGAGNGPFATGGTLLFHTIPYKPIKTTPMKDRAPKISILKIGETFTQTVKINKE